MSDAMDGAFNAYVARFEQHCGSKPDGAFVKFGKHMVQKLPHEGFPERFERYVKLQDACKRMLSEGSTISDAVMLDYEEAAAWVMVEAPNLLRLFQGELGDPGRRAPGTGSKR